MRRPFEWRPGQTPELFSLPREYYQMYIKSAQGQELREPVFPQKERKSLFKLTEAVSGAWIGLEGIDCLLCGQALSSLRLEHQLFAHGVEGYRGLRNKVHIFPLEPTVLGQPLLWVRAGSLGPRDSRWLESGLGEGQARHKVFLKEPGR